MLRQPTSTNTFSLVTKKLEAAQAQQNTTEQAAVFPENKELEIPVPRDIPYEELHFLRELATGLCGTVFHAYWGQESVAVKLLNAAYLKEPDAAETIVAKANIEQEAIILGQLEHPNIVKLYGTTTNPQSSTYSGLVLEYMPYSLCELAHYPHKYTPALRFTIIHGIAQGLAYLHRNNILHRDIKPENVLLDRNKNIKLCDFGLSIKLKAEKYFSQIIEGTSRYIAPEIYQDLCYSRKSDIYSFAVVVWELTASKNYLDSLPEKELITKVMAGYREEIPQDDLKIAGLIKWCWQQEPERRPTADAIVGYLDGKDTEPLSSFCSIP